MKSDAVKKGISGLFIHHSHASRGVLVRGMRFQVQGARFRGVEPGLKRLVHFLGKPPW